MRIYTKTGDAGETGLIGGNRVSKVSSRIKALGEVDELNASLGVARASGLDANLDRQLQTIQSWLFDIGGEIASPPEATRRHVAITPDDITTVERQIDEMTASLPPLQSFILPGGTPAAANLHFSRCVCRRAERAVLELDLSVPGRPELKMFLNRLSDYLFVAARMANYLEGVADVPWTPSPTAV